MEAGLEEVREERKRSAIGGGLERGWIRWVAWRCVLRAACVVALVKNELGGVGRELGMSLSDVRL